MQIKERKNLSCLLPYACTQIALKYNYRGCAYLYLPGYLISLGPYTDSLGSTPIRWSSTYPRDRLTDTLVLAPFTICRTMPALLRFSDPWRSPVISRTIQCPEAQRTIPPSIWSMQVYTPNILSPVQYSLADGRSTHLRVDPANYPSPSVRQLDRESDHSSLSSPSLSN